MGSRPEENINSRLYFDRNDYVLLNIVNDVLNRDESHKLVKNLLIPYLHPHGIKEMAATMGLRIAYAVIHLLGSLEAGKASDRLNALRSLRDEVLCSSQSMLRINTGRVLLEIMKELVRSHGDYQRQLILARDFRTATYGKPRFIRKQLDKYHLIELPEEWNHVAFDDHVHDANTKGRKSPTHLIMDAWIKGVRRLTVIYYNYVDAEVINELLESADIMGIRVTVGIEYSVRFRDRYIKLIWSPKAFTDKQEFSEFIRQRATRELMAEGRQVSRYRQGYVIEVLKAFNTKHLPVINEAYGINLEPIDQDEFLSFVGTGQPSLFHLGTLIYSRMLPDINKAVERLREQLVSADPEEQMHIRHTVEIMDTLDVDAIIEGFLKPEKNQGIHNPYIPQSGGEVPAMLKMDHRKLLDKLTTHSAASHVTLTLSNLSTADVLEILYDCRGRITHLEIFNLNDYTTGNARYNAEINTLQLAVNQGNVIKVKRIIRKVFGDLGEADAPDEKSKEVREKILAILYNIPNLLDFYKNSPLRSKVGSDSTGTSRHRYGMGLVVTETLGRRARNKLGRKNGGSALNIPIQVKAFQQVTYLKEKENELPWNNKASFRQPAGITRPLCAASPKSSLFNWQKERWEEWGIEPDSIQLQPNGNVATLGWMQQGRDHRLTLEKKEAAAKRRSVPFTYLNSYLKNELKIFIGFIPAFATFFFTKDWWLLAYGGAFIWFGITGLRNIIQSVLGAGGISRSPLLKWKEYVSWDRLADSLLYTGFSVPLLDLLVKTLILDRLFGINTATSPFALYSFMALANGIYISGHNIFRGLPREAAFGNFFRSILSIPIAVLLNWAIGGIMGAAGVVAVNDILQKWAAVISKFASDCVAGFIEGIADRLNNIRFRTMDYAAKISQVLNTYAALETLFPESDVLRLLEEPDRFIRQASKKKPELVKIVIINALDLLYIWMYQPRGTSTLTSILESMTPEERRIVVASQLVLCEERQISQLFVDGVFGKKFASALSFYLDRWAGYLKFLQDLYYRFPIQEETD